MQQRITRNPVGTQPSGFIEGPAKIKATQQFNADLRYIQGFRQVVAGSGDSLLKIQLNAPGKAFLGLTIIAAESGDLSDTQATLSINSNNIGTDFSVISADPTKVQGMLFFPFPQPLGGNDTITLKFTKNNANAVTALVNIFYVPRLG